MIAAPTLSWQDIDQYWLMLPGLLIVYFFARTHFNSPEYSLAGYKKSTDRSVPVSPRNSPAARLRTAAPPIFTTPRDRYRRAEWKYVAGIEAAFMFLGLSPNALANIPGLEKLPNIFGTSINSHVIAAMLLVTGFLSSFPLVREADRWFVKFLHNSASIPDDAEDTAGQLFKEKYIPDRDIEKAIADQIQSRTMLAIFNKTMDGSLESRWLQIRCLAETLTRRLTEKRYKPFRRRFETEFDDIYETVVRLREAVVEHLAALDEILPDTIENIDTWISNNKARNHNIKETKKTRSKLLFDIEALHYRICLFSSLMAYSVGSTDDDIDRILSGLGWSELEIILPPRRAYDVLLVGSAATLATCLVISVIYTLIVQRLGISVPTEYAPDVPTTLKQASAWAAVAALLHAAAASMATFLAIGRIKRLKAQKKPLESENPIAESCLLAAISSVIPFFILSLYPLLGITDWTALWWTALPFTTSMFSIGYVRSSVGDRRATRFNQPIVQAVIMGGIAFFLAFILAPKDPVAAGWPPILWAFAAYATVIAGAIGFTLGEVFKRSLAKNINRQFASDQGSKRVGLLFVSSGIPVAENARSVGMATPPSLERDGSSNLSHEAA